MRSSARRWPSKSWRIVSWWGAGGTEGAVDGEAYDLAFPDGACLLQELVHDAHPAWTTELRVGMQTLEAMPSAFRQTSCSRAPSCRQARCGLSLEIVAKAG